MKKKRWPQLALIASALASLALSGCVVAPAAPPAHVHYDRVIVAPPPPRVEVVGVAPYPGHIWIGGHWGWHGKGHHWVPGRWEAPRHGHRWVPHRWEKHHDHWREHHGRWERH
jgi:hypothetical protein